jgi:hypothetical protein
MGRVDDVSDVRPETCSKLAGQPERRRPAEGIAKDDAAWCGEEYGAGLAITHQEEVPGYRDDLSFAWICGRVLGPRRGRAAQRQCADEEEWNGTAHRYLTGCTDTPYSTDRPLYVVLNTVVPTWTAVTALPLTRTIEGDADVHVTRFETC